MRTFARWWTWALLGLAVQLVPWPAAVADAVYLGATLPALARLTSPLVSAVPMSVTAGVLLVGVAVLLALLVWPGGGRSAGRALGWSIAVLLVAFPFAFGLGYRTSRVAPVGQGAPPEAYDEARRLALDRLVSSADAGRAALAAGAPDGEALAACIAEATALVRDRAAPRLPTRVKLLPAGTLLQAGFAGIASPWLLEPHLDAGLPPAAATAVALHELAHAAGFAREAEAEAVALLAGMACEDAGAAYAASLRAAARLASRLPPEERRAYVDAWPVGALEDLEAAAEATQRYLRGPLAEVAERAYDAYLVSQGTEDGMADYDRSVDALVRLLDRLPARDGDADG